MTKVVFIGALFFLLGTALLALAQSTGLRPDQFVALPWTWTGAQSFSANAFPPHPAALTGTGNLDPTSTAMCGGAVEYNSGSAGTLSILNSWPVGCNVSVTAIGAGLATIAAGTGTVHSACSTIRTRAQYSTIWIRSSNTGGVGVVDVSGDCG